MIYKSCTPIRPPLVDLVDRFWLCSDTPPHCRERILPSATFELVINLREDEIRIYDPLHPARCRRFSGAVVSGPYSASFLIDPQQHALMIGVHFKPGGAVPFLGTRADKLRDTHVNLEALWGRTAKDLREKLCTTATPDERFTLLQDALLARLHRPAVRHQAVSIAIEMFAQTNGTARFRDVVRHIGISQRHFIDVFAAEVGLTPKVFCRVRRFEHARDLLCDLKSPNWAQLAVDCGYFDQSHLVRDFRILGGLTPSDYFRRRNERILTHHVPHDG